MSALLTEAEKQHIIRGFEILRDFGYTSKEFLEYCRQTETKNTILNFENEDKARAVTTFIREHGPKYLPHG